jgi:transposase
MKTTPATLAQPADSTPAFAAHIGLDWGDQNHAVALYVAGSPIETQTLDASPETVHAWLLSLAERFHSRPVALALESGRPGALHLLCQYPWLTIHPVNPVTSARYRQAFIPSGAKDDRPDALVLLELLRTHADRLRPLQLDDEATRSLAALVQLRRDAVDRRTQCLNQLTSLLKLYYPQALDLAGGQLATTLALDFLAKWPDLLALKAARPATVKRFYHTHNVRSQELVAARLQSIAQAVAVTADPAVVDPARLQLRLLVALLRTYQTHIAGFDQTIATAFRAHAEAALFRDLPGAGPALAPRLLVAFGTDRALYPAPASLQQLAGIAPVRESSGAQRWTHWRWRAPAFLRQTFVEWAGQTVRWSAWARKYYEVMRQRGKSHQVILRALAFKWIRILWKCWQTRTPYDEARYLKSLQRRNSPYFVTEIPAT